MATTVAPTLALSGPMLNKMLKMSMVIAVFTTPMLANFATSSARARQRRGSRLRKRTGPLYVVNMATADTRSERSPYRPASENTQVRYE